MVCPHCERRIPDGSEKCEYCGLAIQVEEEPKPVKEKKPSVWLGTLGALAGALIGSLLLYFACSVAGLFGTVAGMGLAGPLWNCLPTAMTRPPHSWPSP